MTRPAPEGSTRVGAADREEHFAVELAATPEASVAARRAVIAGNGALPTDVRDDVLLLLTELVTNAVRHANAGPDTTLRVEFRQRSRAVRVAVYDEGPGFAPHAPALGGGDKGGWGLRLLDRIADCWAVTPTATGTCVSFEIRYDGSPSDHRVASS
jgi:anti-sigma regulatory factor (Ser/Thr protein kinase)